MSSSAILLMMPDGQEPEAADFAAGETFKTYEAAIRQAHARTRPDEPLVPWIRLAGKTMNPAQIMTVNTPPEPPSVAAGTEVSDRLDEDLEDTFPASDPPSRTAP